MATDYQTLVDVDAVAEISSAVLMAAGAVMKAHGNSPNGAVIIAAGFSMALRSVGADIDRAIPLIVREMLSK